MGAFSKWYAVLLLAGLVLMTVPSAALQQTAIPPAELSHQERFASKQERLERAERGLTSRLEAQPGDARVLTERGVTRLQMGKTQAALGDLSQAVSLDPSNADALANLAYAYWTQSNLTEALKAARHALAIEENHAGANFYVGRILMQTGGDISEAIRHLERAAERNPEDVDVQFELFSAYRRAREFSRAALQLRQLGMVLPPSHAGIFYAEGLLQADLGNLKVAVERFRRALAINPELDSVRQDLGVALAQSSQWKEAVEVLEPLAQRRPQSFAVAYFHALSLENAQRPQEAEAEARRAVSLRPDAADGHTLLGIILAARGAHPEAVESLGRAVTINATNFDAQFYLGRERYALRDLPGAADAFRAALHIRPEDPEARFFLATVLEAAGEKDPALAEYRELISRRPRDPRGYIGLGAILAKYGETEDAVAQLQRARELEPGNFEAALALGRLLAKSGRVEAAIARLEEAVALRPDNAEAHYQLGLALRRAERAQEAEREFATVERLNRERRGTGMADAQPQIPERE